MIKLGDNNVTLKLGDNDVSKVYLGENQVYPSAPATNLVMQRISDTEYLVTGDGGTADLTFTRESDSFVDAKGVQSLPYTFTHTAGEKWSVNGVNSWGISSGLSGYLEAQNSSDLDFNDYMEVMYYRTGGDMTYAIVGKYEGTHIPRWYISGNNSGVGIFANDGTNPTSFRPLLSVNNEWRRVIVNKVGNTLNVSDGVNNYSTQVDFAIGNSTLKYKAFQSEASTNMAGIVNYIKHGTEEFLMQEGSGTTTVGSEGTVLNLVGESNWVKI